VLGEVFSPLLHLDEHARLPHEVSECGAATAPGPDALFERCPGIKDAAVAESLKEPVEEDLRLPLLVAVDIRAPPLDEDG